MSVLADIPAFILAGGFGTRLQSVVGNHPKALARVAGRPFLEHLLIQLDDAGIERVVLCTGYKAEAIEAHFGSSFRSMRLTYSRETTALGTGGALREACSTRNSGPALVLNGDSYCAADLPAFVARHLNCSAEASLLLAEVADTSRYGAVETDEAGAVLRFSEKSAANGPGWINAGVYCLGPNFLASLPSDSPLSLERQIFPNWIDRGLFAQRSAGWFIDIGTPDSYAQADQLFGMELAQ